LFAEAIEIFHIADTENLVQMCYSPNSMTLPLLQAGMTSKFKQKDVRNIINTTNLPFSELSAIWTITELVLVTRKVLIK
jgi:hypothetical protein